MVLRWRITIKSVKISKNKKDQKKKKTNQSNQPNQAAPGSPNHPAAPDPTPVPANLPRWTNLALARENSLYPFS